MQKFLIASDIHGSAHYCRLLMEQIGIQKPDKVILLGDLLYHGPRNDLPKDYAPREVIKMLNSIKDLLICVRGNCDAEVDQMVLYFPIMADYTLIDAGYCSIFATHGHLFDKDSLPPHKSGCIFLMGHTHVPEFTYCDDILYANPGSVSIPKENSPHSCLLFENNCFIWLDLETGEKYKEHRVDS